MLGDINPQSVRIAQIAVVYPGRNHVTTLTIKRYDGRSYKPVDLDDLTRVVLVFPGTSPTIAFDSTTDSVFTWAGNVLTIDLSDYAMPESIQPSHLIVFDAEHPQGQVLVDNLDSRLEFDFRLISTTGTLPPPEVQFITDAPQDGATYGRKDGEWVSLESVVSGVASVNGQSGVVVLDTDDVSEGATNLYYTNARAAAAAPVQSVNGETGAVSLSAADVGADATGTAAAAVEAHVSDTTPHENLLNVTKVGFNTAAGASATNAGEIVWNDTDKTLDIGIGGGITLQAGQELQVRGLNNSGASILNGQAVYISGASGNRLVFSKATASQIGADKTIAVLTQDIANNQQGQATVLGLVRDLNTSAFAEGVELWLSPVTAGALTATKPAPPNNAVRIGYVVRSHATQGSIFVRVQVIESIPELHDVSIIALTDGDILSYDADASVWRNTPNTGGSGEANTASNLGAGVGVWAQKVGVDLQFKSLVAGSGITLTPAANTITITSSGGSGAVDSVNGQTGVVVLDTDDISEGATNLYYTNARAAAAAPVQSVDGQTGAVSLSGAYAPLSHVGDTGAAHGNAVASGAAGFMTGADKAKLDGVASGATANANTDSLAEGSTNLYFTALRVLGTLMSGFTLVAGGTVLNTDSLLVAIGKLQSQINGLTTSLSGKQDTLVSGTNIKTINGASVLGGGDLTVSGGASLPVVQALSSSRTLALVDANTFNVNSTSSAYTVTIPDQTAVAWAADTEIHFLRSSTGAITITAAAGVSINGVTAASVTLSVQHGAVTIKRVGLNAWWLGGLTSEVFGRDNILGVVSQSAGVPTGAIIERGSNANGVYIKWADGTQICMFSTGAITIQCTASVGGSTPYYAGLTYTFPAAFVAAPEATARGRQPANASIFTVADCTTTVVNIFVNSGTNASITNCTAGYVAIGRWF